MRSPESLRSGMPHLLPRHRRCARKAHRQALHALRVGFTADTYPSHVLPGMQEDAAGEIDAALRGAV